MGIFALSSWWFFVIEFFSQQCDFNFRRSEQKFSEFWILRLSNSNLPNMINSNASFLFQKLNQHFVLPLDFVWGSMNSVDNLLICQSLKFIFCRNSLIELIKNILELFFNVIYHLVSILYWLFSTFLSLFAEIFFFDDFLENSFVVCKLIIFLIIFSLKSWTYFLKLIFVFLQLSFCSQNFKSWLIFDLLLIYCQEWLCSVTDGKSSWKQSLVQFSLHLFLIFLLYDFKCLINCVAILD